MPGESGICLPLIRNHGNCAAAEGTALELLPGHIIAGSIRNGYLTNRFLAICVFF